MTVDLSLLSPIAHAWQAGVAGLSAAVVVPVGAALGITERLGNPADVAEALMISVLHLVLIAGVLRPLESWWPAERWDNRDHTRVDRLNTILMIMGLFPLFSFLVLTPVAQLFSDGAGAGADAPSGLKLWVPWFNDHPWLLFGLYYVLYDLAYYLMHRTQHLIPWWWALHSLHHSQRQMSCWTNDRTHYIDGVLQSFVLASVGLVMGVDAAEFAWMTLISELVQNLSHANLRWHFGRVGDRLFVGPLFHRLHHMQRDPTDASLHNCNYGQVLSIWDVLFGTARYEPGRIRPTGVSDPVVDADNGRGLVSQQWHVAKRFWGALRRRAGWKPGDVSFGPGYVPVPDGSAPHADAPAARPGAGTH